MELVHVSAPAGPSAGPTKVLEDAVEDFQTILTDDQRRKLRSIGEVRDVDTVMVFAAQLDRENQLKKGRGIASRLLSVLECVQTFSTVVETFVSSNPEIAALVWGSIKLAMLITVKYTSYFETLSGILMNLSKQCPRFADYQALYPSSARLQKALCDFHASIVRFCKHVVEALQRPWQGQLRRAIFQSFKQEFDPDVNDIQTLSAEVTHQIAFAKAQIDKQEQELQKKERAAESKSRSRLKKFIPKVEGELDTIKELRLQQSARQSMKQRQRLLDFLSSHHHTPPFQEACKKHQYNTAEWIFDTPEFTRWYDGTGAALLWCSGKIGSGKTILLANTIKHVYTTKADDARVVFFFLQYDNPDSLTAETVIRSIIRQTIDATMLPKDVEQQLESFDWKPFVGLEDWVRLLGQRIEHMSALFIFIDGLDECDAAERRALLDALSSLSTTSSGLRICIASRDSVEVDLKGRFSHIEHVVMAPDALTPDIRHYVTAALENRIQNQDVVVGDPRLLDIIKDTLTHHADGMFIWVVFLIDELCVASCDDDIRKSLRNLPKDLQDTFTRALSRILSRQQRVELVQKIFQWVAAAKRPLALDELREAVSIDIGQPYLIREKLVREMSPIVLWCENLLQVTEDEAPSVQFAHKTIRDFITGAKLPAQLTGFHVDAEEADHFAGEICVTYLHLNDFKTTIARRPQELRVNPLTMMATALSQRSKMTELVARVPGVVFRHRKAKEDLDLAGALATYSRADADGGLDAIQRDHPFLKYAAKHWLSHTVKFQKGRSNTWGLWHHLVTNGHSLAWVPWQESPFDQEEHAILMWSHQTRHYALLRHMISVTGIPEPKGASLMEKSASAGDNEAIAIFLEAECPMHYINQALGMVSLHGHVEVVEQLLNAGANASHPHPKFDMLPLQLASLAGHLQVVQRLLDAGANVDSMDQCHIRTALHWASVHGRLQVVERLLDAGADVNTTSPFYNETALHFASESGHLQVVERLLDAGADVNIADKFGETTLHRASRDSHLQIIERLLDTGAVVNIADKFGEKTLHWPSGDDELQIIERLLDAGADINIANKFGETTLHWPWGGGHPQIIERLLDAGADFNIADKSGKTTLHWASRHGHLQVVKRLLQAGADVNATFSDVGTSALLLASSRGHLEVVKELLGAGAKVDPEESGTYTALWSASRSGYLQVVEQLLDAGASVDAVGLHEGGTPFQAALARGHHLIAERLIAAGAKRRIPKL